MKKISFIVPSYKSEKYLTRCLNSLVNQTLDEIEIICVNDGSPGKDLNIMKSFKTKYKEKIKIIDKKNEGIWKARLSGLEQATGEYVAFIDSDDYIDLNYGKIMYEKAINSKSELVICGFERIDAKTDKVVSREMCKSQETIYVRENLGPLIMLNGSLWNKIIKRNVLKDILKWDINPKIMEDLIVLLCAYQKTKTISFVDKSLVYYMLYENSNISTVNQDKMATAYESMLKVKGYYEKDLIEFLDVMTFLHLGISMAFRCSYDKTINFKKFLKDNQNYLNLHFGLWKDSKYISTKYMVQNKFLTLKLWIVKQFYKLNMFNLFLKVYKFSIKYLKIDIKW